MQGFKAIQEYTDGFIKSPPRDKVEIRYVEEKIPQGTIGFIITDGEAWAFDEENSYDEIIRSGAGTTARYDTSGELCASVQGGDNESYLTTIFDGGQKFKDIDKIWGKFNYKKREPGSRILSPQWGNLNPYGFLFETRSWDEIVRLGRN